MSEIAEHLGVHKSGAHRVLQALVQAGYVEQTPRHRYRLAIRVLELGNTFRFQTEILRVAEMPMMQLALHSGWTTHLAQWHQRDVLELLRIDGHNNTSPPVLRKPAHATALGKVLLTFGDKELIESYIGLRTRLTQYTASTLVKPDLLRMHLEDVQGQGYAVGCMEFDPEVFCLAVPICGRSGNLLAALSMSKKGDGQQGAKSGHLVRHLMETAHIIERAIRANLDSQSK